MAACYVYFIQSGTRKRAPIKIGVANDPEKRILELQTGNPSPLKIISLVELASRDSAYNLEAQLHSVFSDHKMVGEWFRGDIVIDSMEKVISESCVKSGYKFIDLKLGKNKGKAGTLGRQVGNMQDRIETLESKVEIMTSAIESFRVISKLIPDERLKENMIKIAEDALKA